MNLGNGQLKTLRNDRRCCIFDVQDTPCTLHVRLRRRVYEKRFHRQDSSLRNKAVDRGYLTCKVVNFVVRQYAQSVRSGKDTQRTIVCRRVV